jgi:hypothetical protein
MGLIDEKTESRKSRATIPLRCPTRDLDKGLMGNVLTCPHNLIFSVMLTREDKKEKRRRLMKTRSIVRKKETERKRARK